MKELKEIKGEFLAVVHVVVRAPNKGAAAAKVEGELGWLQDAAFERVYLSECVKIMEEVDT